MRFPCNHVGVRSVSLHRLVVKCGVPDYNFDDYSSIDLKYCGGGGILGWAVGGISIFPRPPTPRCTHHPMDVRARVRESDAHFSFDLECRVRCVLVFRNGGGSASCPFIGAFPTRGCISLLWRPGRHGGACNGSCLFRWKGLLGRRICCEWMGRGEKAFSGVHYLSGITSPSPLDWLY